MFLSAGFPQLLLSIRYLSRYTRRPGRKIGNASEKFEDNEVAIEKIQKRATKLVISLRKLLHIERLQHLNLYTVKYRRLRGDMIEVFKILHHMYDSSVAPELIRNTNTSY